MHRIKKTINKETLLRLLIVKGQLNQAFEIFRNDFRKELPLNYILHTILEHVRHKDSCPSFLEEMGEKGRICYEFVTDIINEGGHGYELDRHHLELAMTKQRNIDVLEAYFMPMIEIHRAVINKDADTINKYMELEREETVELLIEHYIGECGREHHDELTYSSKIKMGTSGGWINLNNPSTYVDVTYGNGWEEKDVSFLPWGNPADLTVTEGDLTRIGMTWIHHANENVTDARYVLKYLDLNGYEELNEADEIKLSHNLEASDILLFHQLVHDLLEKEKYTIKKVEDEGSFYDEPYECPLVYYQDKSICYTYKFVEGIQPACIVRRIARATDLAISLDTYMNMANLPPSHPPAVMVNLPRLFHHFDGKYRQARLNFSNNQIRFV